MGIDRPSTCDMRQNQIASMIRWKFTFWKSLTVNHEVQAALSIQILPKAISREQSSPQWLPSAYCRSAPAKSGMSLAIYDKAKCAVDSKTDHKLYTEKELTNSDRNKNPCRCVTFPEPLSGKVASYAFSRGGNKGATINFLYHDHCKYNKDPKDAYIENNLVEDTVTRGAKLRSAWVCAGRPKDTAIPNPLDYLYQILTSSYKLLSKIRNPAEAPTLVDGLEITTLDIGEVAALIGLGMFG
ncbi:hypothetical protein BJ138DRAFT_163446 [Hygrophoropsis aurantiaca]|uniref:Uncharacterized protein n=1 Tax=Hygrophoropsis aurantiaca TaxID=72124 RepID=A0ACB8AA87_9AGAM|nr:hypothetical protein BJ138DRAFT_163446 [Hygrophoropsis aurantiaca]